MFTNVYVNLFIFSNQYSGMYRPDIISRLHDEVSMLVLIYPIFEIISSMQY